MEERIEYQVLAPQSVAWHIQAALVADRSGNVAARDQALREAQRIAEERRLDGPRYDVAHECNGVRLAEIEGRLEELGQQLGLLRGWSEWIERLERDLVQERRLRQADVDRLTRQLDELDARMEEADDKLSVLSGRIDNNGDALAHRLDALEAWQDSVTRKALLPLPGVDQMREMYNAESDAAFVSYWDMRLLRMIECTNERLGMVVGGA